MVDNNHHLMNCCMSFMYSTISAVNCCAPFPPTTKSERVWKQPEEDTEERSHSRRVPQA